MPVPERSIELALELSIEPEVEPPCALAAPMSLAVPLWPMLLPLRSEGWPEVEPLFWPYVELLELPFWVEAPVWPYVEVVEDGLFWP